MKKINPKRSTENSKETLVYNINRTIYFFDLIESNSACEAIKILDKLENENKKDIEFILCSDGGSVYDGLALYDRIRRSCCNINMTGTGLVASMAVIVFLGGDYRCMSENCVILNHQSSDNLAGTASDLEIGVKETLRLNNRTIEIISDHTRLTEKQIISDIQKGDDYIHPERALNDGFVHKILKNQKVVRKRRK